MVSLRDRPNGSTRYNIDKLGCSYHYYIIGMKEQQKEKGNILVQGARVHNLKNISVEIPRYSICTMTGLSGSGKSSLAFDTIYAEGNRRYLDTMSSYARGFIAGLERPDVDKIEGLSPVISIEQKTTNRNPRSTVGTTTEIYDFLRLLYARTATAYSLTTNKPLVRYTEEEIITSILKTYPNAPVYLLAPVVRERKGHYRELLEKFRKQGYTHALIDGVITELTPGLALSRYKIHSVEILVDKVVVKAGSEERLRESLRTALRLGKGLIRIQHRDSNDYKYFSRNLMDAETGNAIPDPAPHSFSFNSPQGSCPKCKGLGQVPAPALEKIIPDTSKSIKQGALSPLGSYKSNMIFCQLEAIATHHGYSLDDPIGEYPEELMDDIMNGADYPLRYKNKNGQWERLFDYPGLLQYMKEVSEYDSSNKAKAWAEQFNTFKECPSCQGKRLTKEALSFRIDGKDIIETTEMPLLQFRDWIATVPGKVTPNRKVVAEEITKEIIVRTNFLIEVGLEYLTLSRATNTLSGGEMQRIRLATQIGSKLVNVLYILDEPSIGLHQRDNIKLIQSLKHLRDVGNTLIVVEHDKDMMLESDYVVDLGPGAGRKGGKIVFAGTPSQMLQSDTLTACYLKGTCAVEIPPKRRKGIGAALELSGAVGNNLKGDLLSIPLGTLVGITGVSGSGKSTLINDTLYPALSQHFYNSIQTPLPFKEIRGLEHINKVVSVDQSPIGRMPRSNPATYIGVFTDIRNLFVDMPESKIRGYKPGRFSFNVKGGRCETCKGNGYKRIEMTFLPDVYVPCEVCRGKRYNRETLEVRYKGKSIADVLDMTVNMAVEFFEGNPAIYTKVKMLQDVGLGYIKLGQPSSTLSGGECQRIKLAAELAKKDTGKTIYFLDEPTTGLHFEDIRILMKILHRLVNRGNTVVVIEHNMDVIKSCDYLIDLGPDGGSGGGKIIFSGTPEEMVQKSNGYTAYYLKRELKPGT